MSVNRFRVLLAALTATAVTSATLTGGAAVAADTSTDTASPEVTTDGAADSVGVSASDGAPLQKCRASLKGNVTWAIKESTLSYYRQGDGSITTTGGTTYDVAANRFISSVDSQGATADNSNAKIPFNGSFQAKKYNRGGGVYLLDVIMKNTYVTIDGTKGTLFTDFDTTEADITATKDNPPDHVIKDNEAIATFTLDESVDFAKPVNFTADLIATDGYTPLYLGSITGEKLSTINVDVQPSKVCEDDAEGPDTTPTPAPTPTPTPAPTPTPTPAPTPTPTPTPTPAPTPTPDPSTSDTSSPSESTSATPTPEPKPDDSLSSDDDNADAIGGATGSSKELRKLFGGLYNSVFKGGLTLMTLAVVAGVIAVIGQHMVTLNR